MPNTLPITIQMSTLPPNASWTPQQFADAIAQRLSLVTQQSFALFVTGSTAPLSNVGPWLKDGTEWWVWSNTAGAYVPQTVTQESLGYFIGAIAPDQNIYQIWIETTAGGSPLSVKIYYSGSWVDVYAAKFANYSTTAQMNAAISAAIAGIPGTTIVAGTQIFKARPSTPVNVVFGGGGTQTGVTTLDTEDYDPDNVFAASRFTATANGYYSFKAEFQAGVTAGAPTDFDVNVTFGVNGGSEDSLNNEAIGTSLVSRVLTGACDIQLNTNDYVELLYSITLDAAGTVEINDQYTRLSGFRIR